MSFSKIYLHRLEELLSQMKELNQQTYINNSLDILAIENAINYIELTTKENNRLQEKIKELENKKNVFEIKGMNTLIETLQNLDNTIKYHD